MHVMRACISECRQGKLFVVTSQDAYSFQLLCCKLHENFKQAKLRHSCPVSGVTPDCHSQTYPPPPRPEKFWDNRVLLTIIPRIGIMNSKHPKITDWGTKKFKTFLICALSPLL